MINRIRAVVIAAAGAAVLAAGFGAVTVGTAGTANADVCWNLETDGTTYYYYC